MTNWKYLPELPDSDRRVLIAAKGFESSGLVQEAFLRNGEWYNSGSCLYLGYQDRIYAWTELPELPPVSPEKYTEGCDIHGNKIPNIVSIIVDGKEYPVDKNWCVRIPNVTGVINIEKPVVKDNQSSHWEIIDFTSHE